MRPRTWPKHNMPQVIDLPCGFRVRVKSIIPTQMKAQHGEYYDAIFKREDETIYVNRNLKNPRKWFVLAYEMRAAVDYWNEWLVKKGISRA